MCHLYLDDLSRNKGKGKLIVGHGVAMSVESAPDPTSIVCHNCGKEGHYQSGCAVPGKTYDKRNNGHVPKSRKSGGKARDITKKWYSLHKTKLHTTTPTVSSRERRARRRAGCFATALGAHSLSSESDEKPAINFDDDFDGGFQFKEVY